MAAGAAIPGLFFTFAAMVLLIFVRRPVARMFSRLIATPGVRVSTNMERRPLPDHDR